ncbi:MAG: hypothetical protein JNK35_02500, partial [Phycisphaerae bacterium]|nr:hypothetical protein [Phycisphaerae bacterium]
PLGLQSEAGSITIATAAKVAGTGLALSSATGSLLNTSISPASLIVTGPATSAGGSVTATGNVTFAGPLTLNVSTTLTGTGVSLGLVDGNATGLRALTINASVVTTFGGTVGGALALASVTTNAAGSVVFGASVFTTGAQTYNETALSLTAAAALSAGGDITFAPLSTLAAGANNLTLRANEITLGGDLTGTGALTIEAATAAQGITLGAGSAANLDLTAAELARIGAAFASVTIGRADAAGQIVVAGASTFTNPTALRAPQPGGSILVNAALTGTGDASFTFVGSGATTTLNADVRTAGAPITFNDSVLIGAASVTVDTTNNGAAPAGASITFNFVVDSEPGETNSLTVLSGIGGATVFASPIGSTRALASISTDAGGTLSIVGATTTGTQSFADAAANIRGTFVTAGGGITFSGAVTLGAASTVNPGAGPALFGGAVNGAFALQVNSAGATTFNAPVGASVPLASFTSDAPGTLLVSGIAVSGALQARDSIITLSAGSTYSSSGGVIATTAGSSVRLVGNATIAAPAGFQATLAATIDALTPGVGALLVTGPAAVLGAIGGSTPLGSVRFTGQAGVSSVGVFASNANGGLGRVTFDASPALSGSVTLQATGIGLELPAGFSASTGVVSLLATQITLGGPATAAAGSVQVVVGGPTPGTPITLGNSGAPAGLHLDAAEIGRFASGFARLTFGRADGSGNVIIASALTFNDPVLLRAPVSPGRILVNAAITALDGIEFQGSGATVVLNADVRTAGAPVTFNDGVLVASASITIDTTNSNAVPAGAAITFAPGFTLNSEAGEANALTLRGGTSGVTTLGGAVGAAPGGALGALSTDAGGSTIIGGGTVNVVNAALFGDGVAFIAHGEVRASLGVVTFASAFAASTFHAIVSGAEIDFLGPVSGTGRIRLEPNIASRDINLAHNTEGAGDALDLTKNELDRFAPGFEVIEIGKDDGSGTLDVQEYAFTSPIFLQMPALGGAIVVNGDLACETDGGAIGIRGTGSTTHLRGSISTRGGPITIDDSLLIETADAFISTRRAERAGAPVSITGVINSLPFALRDLSITSGVGAITLLGEVGGATNGELGSLTLNGDGGINLFSPRIRTRGAQSYNGPVTLGPAITLQNVNSPITFNGTVNGAGNLTIAPGSGATSFNGAVGGSTQLNALLINAGSTRIFNAPVSVGVLTVFGGTVEFNRDASIGTGLLIAGTLGGSGNVTFPLPLTWVGGSMTGTGTTTIALSGALVISGGPKTLSRSILNAGTIYWTDGDLTFSNGSLTNLPTGQFFAQSAGQFIGATGINTLTNQGLIERSGAGASAFTNLTLSNTGQITLASGDLSVTPAGGTFIDAGTSTIAEGSALLVTGNYTQTAVARFNTTIAGPAAFGRITVTGTATLTGTLAVSLQDGFLPQPGQRFDVVTAATRAGTFATTLLPTPPGRILDVQYGDTFASVVVRSGADFNGDGSIDPDDLADFIAGFFSNPADPRTDFNGDGVIDPDDLADFIAAFFGG